MKRLIIGVIIGICIGSAITAIAAGTTKYESANRFAKPCIAFGTADSGDNFTRIKTTATGAVCIQ